jgi:transposase-like protein
MFESPDSVARKPAMTKIEAKPAVAAVNELFSKRPDGLRELVRAVMQETLEAEMTDALGAEKGVAGSEKRAAPSNNGKAVLR